MCRPRSLAWGVHPFLVAWRGRSGLLPPAGPGGSSSFAVLGTGRVAPTQAQPPQKGRGGLQAGLWPTPWRGQRSLCCPCPLSPSCPRDLKGRLGGPGPFHVVSSRPSAGQPVLLAQGRASTLCPTCLCECPPLGPGPSQPCTLPRPQSRTRDGHCRGSEPPAPEVVPADADSPGLLSGAAVSQFNCSLSPGAHPSPSREPDRAGVPGVGNGWSNSEVPLGKVTAGGGWEPLRGA